MSAERRESNDEERYPSVNQLRDLFTPVSKEISLQKRRPISPKLKLYIENKEFQGILSRADEQIFYDGFHAGVELVNGKKKSTSVKLAITEDVIKDCFIHKETRRYILGLTPEEDWLKGYDQLAEEYKEDLSSKIFDLALEQPSPSVFLGGVTLAFDLLKTATELHEMKNTPRQETSEALPLKNINVIQDFVDVMKDQDLFMYEVTSMRRENDALYTYVQNRYKLLAEYNLDNAMGFLYAAVGAYHLIGKSAIEQGKLPAHLPQSAIGIKGGKDFKKACKDEIAVLSEKDYMVSFVLQQFLNEGLSGGAPIGSAEGFALVFRSFRSAKEHDQFKASLTLEKNIDQETRNRISERENKAVEARKAADAERKIADEERKMLEEWYDDGGQEAA